MKSTIFNISVSLVISTFVFSSCKKVIDIDLNDSNPQFVIEANIINDGTPCTVDITKTINFSESNNFPAVTNAIVTLSDNAGNSENLQMTSNGHYTSSTITGVQGRTYTLNVNVDGKTFNAVSTLPYEVNLDSAWVQDLLIFGSNSYSVIPEYKDSSGTMNFYRFKLFVNDTLDKNIFLEDDVFTDGRTVTIPLFGEIEIEAGDTLRLQMMCIDKPAYLFFFSLASLQNGSTGAPANPVSNFSGGCLGYFSAHTLMEKTMVVF
ncbi:MAG: DUF4249 domain-containing protein [Bacteroidota bacterium]